MHQMIPDCFAYNVISKVISVMPKFSPFIFGLHNQDPSEDVGVPSKILGGLNRSMS